MPLYIAQQLLGSQKNIRKKRRDMLAEDALEDDADEAAVRPVLFAPLARQEAQQYLLSAIEDYVERDEDLSAEISGSPLAFDAGQHSDRPDTGALLPERDHWTPDAGATKARKNPISREVSQTFRNVGSRVGDWVDDRALSMKALFAGDLLNDGQVRQLKGRGLIFGAVADEPDIEFHFVRTDSVVDTTGLSPQKFSAAEVGQGGRLRGVFDASAGDRVTSRSRNGTVIGVWGGKNVLDEDVKIFEISNGLSGSLLVSSGRCGFDRYDIGRGNIVHRFTRYWTSGDQQRCAS